MIKLYFMETINWMFTQLYSLMLYTLWWCYDGLLDAKINIERGANIKAVLYKITTNYGPYTSFITFGKKQCCLISDRIVNLYTELFNLLEIQTSGPGHETENKNDLSFRKAGFNKGQLGWTTLQSTGVCFLHCTLVNMVICTDPTSNKSRITRYCYSLQEVKEAKENVVQSCYNLMFVCVCVCLYVSVCVGHKPTGGTLHCHHQEASMEAFPRKTWVIFQMVPMWRKTGHWGLTNCVCASVRASSKESRALFHPFADFPKLMLNCLKWPQRKSESGEPSPLSCHHLHHSEQRRHTDSNVWLHSIAQCCVGSCALLPTSQHKRIQ